ncbi:hypothetical protein [Streptomyces hydrogenans]|uniref:hypothetical protein n=1 Tax=Streptomyces hydrogenans TaxID=1873719 RepID=UPI003D75DD79
MRFVRSHPARLLAAGLLAAGTLSLTAAAGPAAADVVEPNVSGLAHPNASFTETLDDADYAGDAKTDPTAPESGGPAAEPAPGPTDPAPSPSVTTPAPPAPGPGPVHGGTGGGSMAGTGAGGERLWLLGALAVVLGATGLVAKAAMRGHRG